MDVKRLQMSKTITLTSELFSRLEQFAATGESPEQVIEKLVGLAEDRQAQAQKTRPTLSFVPKSEPEFIATLLTSKRAEVILHSHNSVREVRHWNATKFTANSRLRANVWNGPLKGWKNRDVSAVEVSVLPSPLDPPDEVTEAHIAIAREIQWTLKEVEEYYEHVSLVEEMGKWFYKLTFSVVTPHLLKTIAKLDEQNARTLSVHQVPALL